MLLSSGANCVKSQNFQKQKGQQSSAFISSIFSGVISGEKSGNPNCFIYSNSTRSFCDSSLSPPHNIHIFLNLPLFRVILILISKPTSTFESYYTSTT
ncbi:hypothetical protein HanOQP8_Chr02g0082511 [Helianthus annuus]|nr:hypothetical protein HanLR1_Chr02g0072111 [Helianthus annuus]KAJ0787441.1 hypothetical protein HanOQP8_Chr02g0082511 [Helianthus annuus]